MERHPLFILAGLSLLALSVVLLLRSLGFLESLELKAFDVYLRLANAPQDQSQPVVMVEYTEEDEATFGFPLPDDHLADLLEVISAGGAAGIGLDLIRDRPEPKMPNSTAFERLSHILRQNTNIIGIITEGNGAFRPPPALADRPLQIASATLLPDADQKIRRGLLYLTEKNGPTKRPALALALANHYLATKDARIDWQPSDRLRLGVQGIQPFRPGSSGFYRRPGGTYAGDQLLLTFPACKEGFERHSVSDIIQNQEKIDFEGRIVLVGNTVRTAKDVVDIPLSCSGMVGGKMFGLHLHGQIVSQLIGLAQGTLSPLETTAQRTGQPLFATVIDGAWIWFWTALGGLTALLLTSPLWLMIAATVGFGILLCATGLLFISLDWWLPTVPPAIGFVLALISVISYAMTQARTEREQIMGLFSGVVSKAVADAIWRRHDQDEDAAPEMMTATVMFTDIKGFTTISEELSEPVLADWLNDYMAEMVTIVGDHGGIIEKFAGDGLTIEFGVPEPRDSETEIDADARAAVDCAIAMASALPTLNADWRTRELPEIGIRIGIHTGPLMVGIIGAADRWQYSIIGDTANTAARLESYGKDDPKLVCDVGQCRILISKATFDRLGGRYRTKFVGEASLKGKALATPVYRVIAFSDQMKSFDR